MPLIYITGPSGAGKSTVRNELIKRGYEAHDTDEDGMSQWYDNQTLEPVEFHKPDNRPDDWFHKHSFRLSKERLKDLAARAGTKIIFLCGVPANDSEFRKYYDKTICLVINEETMKHRIATRTTNGFGKSADELKLMLYWHGKMLERYKKWGALMIDASQPLDDVVDEILDAAIHAQDTIGLARGTVRLMPHDNDWSLQFALEATLLHNELGIGLEQIQHVGSTAIPGMVAKPIIDIAIPVKNLQQADDWSAVLATIGYWDKGPQPDMPNRRFFAKGPEEKRTVYLHIVLPAEYKRLIAFRDALRSNAELADEYSQLKQTLAAANSDNRAEYTMRKSDFIENVLNNPHPLDRDTNNWLSKVLTVPFKATKHIHSHQDEVYRIETKSDNYYLKISRSLRSEYDNLKKLDHILLVPRVIDFYHTDDNDYLLISELPGKNLVELIGVWSELTIVEKFADAIRQLHELDAIKVFPKASPKDVLLHGDMALPNIIISDEGDVSYIDFGQLSFGTPELDLADAIWSLQRNLGPSYGELFLKRYGPVTITPKIEKALSYRYVNG